MTILREFGAAIIGFSVMGVYGYVRQRICTAREFQLAAMYVKMNMDQLPEDIQARLSALFKQSTRGDAPLKRTGSEDAKSEAWLKLRSMSRHEARSLYISTVDEVCPGWQDVLQEFDDAGAVSAWASGSVPLETIGEGLVGSDLSLGGHLCELAATDNIQGLLKALNSQSVDTTDMDGMCALHWAADRGYVDIIRMLITKHASVNLQDKDGNTPLHFACYSEQENVIRLLIEAGADVSIRNKDGESVKDLLPRSLKIISHS